MRSQQGLERIAASAVLQVECEHPFAVCCAHRTKIVQPDADRATDEVRQRAVRDERVQRPRTGARRSSAPEHDVARSINYPANDTRQICGIHGPIRVAERDDRRGRRQKPSVRRRPKTSTRFEDDSCAVRASNVSRTVGRAVVHDDGSVSLWQPGERPRQRSFLVETWEHDVYRAHRTASRNGAVANSRIPCSNVTAGIHRSSARSRSDDAVM